MSDVLTHWNERAKLGPLAGTQDRGLVALEQISIAVLMDTVGGLMASIRKWSDQEGGNEGNQDSVRGASQERPLSRASAARWVPGQSDALLHLQERPSREAFVAELSDQEGGMKERQLFKNRNGEDYRPQAVSEWRLRELLQFEKDAAELRAQVAALEAETQQLKQVIANEAAVYQKVFTERARLEAENAQLRQGA